MVNLLSISQAELSVEFVDTIVGSKIPVYMVVWRMYLVIQWGQRVLMSQEPKVVWAFAKTNSRQVPGNIFVPTDREKMEK